jgi:hypothetical protein
MLPETARFALPASKMAAVRHGALRRPTTTRLTLWSCFFGPPNTKMREMKIPTSPYRCPLGPMQPERRDRSREARGPAIAAHPRRRRGRTASRHHGTAIHPTGWENAITVQRKIGMLSGPWTPWPSASWKRLRPARRLAPVRVAGLLHPVAGIRRQPWETWIESRPLLRPPPPSSGCWGR